MAKLLDYLNHLDQDADARDAYIQNPQQAMRNFGLSDDEIQAMLSGDKTRVANLLGIKTEELPTMEIPQF
ncbi:hypothetical protein AAKU67_002796 [Oxalobacteraceae bacterium GrIS 2.11]